MGVIIKNNRVNEWNSAYKKAIHKGLFGIGLEAQGDAKREIAGEGITSRAVLTGFLMNSITFAISGESAYIKNYKDNAGKQRGSYKGTMGNKGDNKVYIGTNVKYGKNVETGNKKMKPRPFLKNTILQYRDKYIKLFKEALKTYV